MPARSGPCSESCRHLGQVLMALSPLQEKEKLYLELKSILARQPGPEAAEQLSIYQVGRGGCRCRCWYSCVPAALTFA